MTERQQMDSWDPSLADGWLRRFPRGEWLTVFLRLSDREVKRIREIPSMTLVHAAIQGAREAERVLTFQEAADHAEAIMRVSLEGDPPDSFERQSLWEMRSWSGSVFDFLVSLPSGTSVSSISVPLEAVENAVTEAKADWGVHLTLKAAAKQSISTGTLDWQPEVFRAWALSCLSGKEPPSSKPRSDTLKKLFRHKMIVDLVRSFKGKGLPPTENDQPSLDGGLQELRSGCAAIAVAAQRLGWEENTTYRSVREVWAKREIISKRLPTKF